MPNNLPQRIDREAIERIIHRAAELQTGERDLGDGLAPEEVVSLGKEVGIPERYLQQAMLEERTRVEPASASGVLDKTIGPGSVGANRVIRGDPADVERRLLRWMSEHELLTIQRQQPERISWEPLRGMSAAIRRSSAAFGGHKTFMLNDANLIAAAISGLEPGFTHVALSAELRGVRGGYVGGVLAMGGCGIAAATVLTVMSPLAWVPLIPIPLFLAAGFGIGRGYTGVVERTRLGLERALDNLDRAEPKQPSPPSGGVAGLLGDVVRAIAGDRPQ